MKDLFLRQKQVLFFILAGALSAVVEIFSFKVFSVLIPGFTSAERNFHGIHFPLSNLFSTSLGIITNYFLSIWFVFERGKHSKRREFAYFMALSAGSTLLSLAFFQIFYRFVFANNFKVLNLTVSREILSKISAIVVVSVANFSLKKRVVFNG